MDEGIMLASLVSIVAIVGLIFTIGNFTGASVVPLGYEEQIEPVEKSIEMCQEHCTRECAAVPDEESKLCKRWCGHGCRWAANP